MKTSKLIIAGLLTVATSAAFAQGSNAVGQSKSDSGAMAQTGSITFEASEPRGHTSVSTTPPVYVPSSAFGFSNNNCGVSDTMAVSVTGFGIGGSKASESESCNTRQDTGTAWNLGLKQVAILRFACFGEAANRQAYEAAGFQCPDDKTKGSVKRGSSGYTGSDPIVLKRLGK